MKRALERENIEVETKNVSDDGDFFLKHDIRTCPVLLEFDNGEVSARIVGVEDIIKRLKDVQNTEI
jgi:glutaredoxin